MNAVGSDRLAASQGRSGEVKRRVRQFAIGGSAIVASFLVGGCLNPWAELTLCTGLREGDHFTVRLISANVTNGDPICDQPVVGISPGLAVEVEVQDVNSCGPAVGPVVSSGSVQWSFDERASRSRQDDVESYWVFSGRVESPEGCRYDVSMSIRNTVETPLPSAGEEAVLGIRLTPLASSTCGEFCASSYDVWVQPGTLADLGLGGAGGAGP